MDLPIIAALATPPGQSGLAVIRLSGHGSAALADLCFRFGPLPGKTESSDMLSVKASTRSLTKLKGYRCALGYIIDPKDEKVIDQCIVTRFVAPHSYTGEESVEFSFHGGNALRRKILRVLIDLGALAAPAGEFTKRAFMNGKLDLAQAEAVMDLVNAEAGLSSEAAMQQLQGSLSDAFARFRERLFSLMAELEIAIDYPEHEDFNFVEDTLSKQVADIRNALVELLNGYRQGVSLKKGLQVALVGAPNVGKSSLLNALSGVERAIVTDIAGTTRDTIDSLVEISGIPVRLIDTAGIRESSDTVERIGVERSHQAMLEADYILWTITPELLEDKSAEEVAKLLHEELQAIPENVPFSLLLNKQDLPGTEELNKFLKDEVLPIMGFDFANRIDLDKAVVPTLIFASAQSGQGLDEVRNAILLVYQNMGTSHNEALRISTERHAEIVQRALNLLEQIEADQNFLPLDVLSQSLLAVGDILGEISGERVSESLINEIFSRFCVGK